MKDMYQVVKGMVRSMSCMDTSYLFGYTYSCGKDLKKLFLSDTIKHFLNGTPMRDLHSEKSIYQPGALRNVSDLL